MSVALLETPPLGLSPDLGPYRRADYEAQPDEPRCELIYGRLYRCHSVSVLHQFVLGALVFTLFEQAKPQGDLVLPLPLDVYLADHSVVQPDILYLRRGEWSSLEEIIEGPPSLLVEIMTPEDGRKDRNDKKRLYAETGVGEYWIVEPRDQQVDFFLNRDGQFAATYPDGDVYTSPLLPNVRLDLPDLWRKVQERQL